MRILYYILAAVLVASGCIIGGILFKKKRVLKYKNDIQKLFTSACMEKNIQDYRIEYVKRIRTIFILRMQKIFIILK